MTKQTGLIDKDKLETHIQMRLQQLREQRAVARKDGDLMERSEIRGEISSYGDFFMRIIRGDFDAKEAETHANE